MSLFVKKFIQVERENINIYGNIVLLLFILGLVAFFIVIISLVNLRNEKNKALLFNDKFEKKQIEFSVYKSSKVGSLLTIFFLFIFFSILDFLWVKGVNNYSSFFYERDYYDMNRSLVNIIFLIIKTVIITVLFVRFSDMYKNFYKEILRIDINERNNRKSLG